MLKCKLAILKKLKNYFKTPTSFLNACNCAGLGSLTFNFLMATAPNHKPLKTVPKEPEPILRPNSTLPAAISQASSDSRLFKAFLCKKYFLLQCKLLKHVYECKLAWKNLLSVNLGTWNILFLNVNLFKTSFWVYVNLLRTYFECKLA